MTIKLAALALALTVGAAADATTYKFSYAADIGLVTGRLTGELQADNNTVLVTGLGDVIKVGATVLPSLPFLTTGSTIYGTPRAPSVTLDGSVLDFFACDTEFCEGQGIGFDPDVVAFSPVFRLLVPAISPDLVEEAQVPGNWSLTAVPEPAAWGLMLAGFAVVGSAARRRRAAVAA